MKKSIKVLFISSVLALTASCQDTLDTSSDIAKKQSIKQMMVGIYPQNQKIFSHALKTIYSNDQKLHSHLSKTDIATLTNQRLKGKTVEEILHLSFLSKKTASQKQPLKIAPPLGNNVVVSNVNLEKTSILVKTNLIK